MSRERTPRVDQKDDFRTIVWEGFTEKVTFQIRSEESFLVGHSAHREIECSDSGVEEGGKCLSVPESLLCNRYQRVYCVLSLF